MKKFILNVIAALFISCLAFANTSEIKTTSNLEFDKKIEIVNETKSETKINEDWAWCYEVGRERLVNEFSGDVTIIIYVRCVDMSQFF